MTFQQYVREVLTQLTTHPEWRTGQTYWNVLADLRPDIANKIHGTTRDPFYQDKRLPDFHEFVLDNW